MTSIQVFNTLTGKKEPFIPLAGKIVKFYACGPTPYDFSHLGHARMAIVWDVVQRYLRHAGYSVTFVRNITDIEDKIIKRAKISGLSADQLARFYTLEFWRDMKDLHVSQPDFEPRATEYVTRMIAFIEELIHKGHAYESAGDVYFEVATFKNYGRLGKKNLDQLLSGARDQVRSQEELSEIKRSTVDFALWKGAKAHELHWQSPWGPGRPGWHIECSTMIKHVLGETIDIHSGGEDLVFPHHENEIAQSESLHEKPLAKYWLHNGFVQVDAEKMSKSLGNFKTIQDLLRIYSPDTIRLLVLQTHYRNPIDLTTDSLLAAKTAVHRLIRICSQAAGSPNADQSNAVDLKDDANVKTLKAEFEEAMNNDFNTAIAISSLFAFAEKISTAEEKLRPGYIHELKSYANILGLKLDDTRRVIDTDTASKIIDLLLELRSSARDKKDFATSDLIRKRLTDLQINVMDTASGATWEKA